MKLSVVIPVYNAQHFIKKAYQSIINQKIENFEIIFVDNNSNDESVKEIQSLVKLDDRVKLLGESKQGAAPARNIGIKNAVGEYIYIFDVDDEIYPNALLNMLDVLETYPNIDAVFGKMIKSYNRINQTQKPQGDSMAVTIKESPYWGLKWFSSLKGVVGPPAFLYRASVFKKIGLFNEAIKNNEDTAFDIKLGMTCNIAFLDMYVYLYFKHENSTIQTAKKKMSRAFMVWPRLVKEHLPFYLKQELPLKFKTLLFAQLYQSMGRQITFTKGFQKRSGLKKQLLSEINEINVPFSIRFYLGILVLLPFEVLRKIYGYKIVPSEIKKIKE